VGAVITGTLLGSAALTLAVGASSRRLPTRPLLLGACGLMAATGLGFATVTAFAGLLLVAVVGTLNPSAGDVSVFLPTEQALLAGEVEPSERPDLYARYNLAGTLAGALGALAAGGSVALQHLTGWAPTSADRTGFFIYAAVAGVIALLYRRLPDDPPPVAGPRRRPLEESRAVVLRLATLFSLDSAASGFVVQSLLVLWLSLRFDLSPAVTGTTFFVAGLLGASSQLLAGRLVRRIGLIRTMAFTHLPANALLALAAFAPNAPVAVGLLLVRALFAQMDVPARQAFVMAVVPPEERGAASSITNVPRSLASATTPLIAGALLRATGVGWPLLIAGLGKMAYDLLLLGMFRHTEAQLAGA
jgi:predicted MFS family arabinose efflux permease